MRIHFNLGEAEKEASFRYESRFLAWITGDFLKQFAKIETLGKRKNIECLVGEKQDDQHFFY